MIEWEGIVVPPALNSRSEQEKASMRKVLLSLVAVSLIAIPAFTKVLIEGEERTAIRFLVQAR